MGGWLDGLFDADDLQEVEDQAPEPATPRPAPPPKKHDTLSCKHCGSDHLHLRSSSRDNVKVVFACLDCTRHSTYSLPLGYVRTYRPLTPAEIQRTKNP
jgi:hypothetical protein